MLFFLKLYCPCAPNHPMCETEKATWQCDSGHSCLVQGWTPDSSQTSQSPPGILELLGYVKLGCCHYHVYCHQGTKWRKAIHRTRERIKHASTCFQWRCCCCLEEERWSGRARLHVFLCQLFRISIFIPFQGFYETPQNLYIFIQHLLLYFTEATIPWTFALQANKILGIQDIVAPLTSLRHA